MDGKKIQKEIGEQFDLWKVLMDDYHLLEKDVRNNFRVKEFDEVLFVGAGSSYHLAVSAAGAFRRLTGETAVAVPASELLFFHEYYLKRERKYACILFSRSGETPETLQALDTLRKLYRVIAIAVSCDPKSTLVDGCEMAFPIKNCTDECFIMTKSFTSMLFVSYMFSVAYGEKMTKLTYLEQLHEEGRAAFEMQRRVVEQVVASAPLERVTILGGGPLKGIAREAALKLDETALLRTKTHTPLELCHGPHAAVGKTDMAITLLSDSARAAEIGLMRELKARGARNMVFSDKKEAEFDRICEFMVLTGRGVPEVFRGILYLPFMQYLSVAAALSKGMDPDDPSILANITGDIV